MTTLISLMRILHVLFATFWVGTTLFSVLYLQPTIAALGPDGGKFMQRLLRDTRYSLAMAVAAVVTVLTGLVMYGPVTGNSTQVMLGPRLPLTIGALAGIAAAVVGGVLISRRSSKLMKLSDEVAGQGGPPTAEQQAQLQSGQAGIRSATIWAAVLMVIAVVGMTW